MATYTPNYNLYKPEPTDQFDDFLTEFGNNMDTIDQNLGGGGGSSTLAGLSDVNLTSPVTDDALIYDGAEWVNTPLSSVAFSGDYTDLTNTPTIPTKTSDLNNDSDFVSDASYVHTDNNFTNADVTKLSGIQAGAEVNVQSDWNEADNTADDYIKNKPTIPTKTSDLNNDSGFLDSSDITVTQVQTTGTKIATIDVDGNSTDLYAPTGGSGGHTIVNESGTALADEPNLQFTDGLKASDDSGNSKTKVGVDTAFTESATRTNIASGDSFSTILGKIKKWFADIPNLFVDRQGDTMRGTLYIEKLGTSISQEFSRLYLGNNIPYGTSENSTGFLRLYAKGSGRVDIFDNEGIITGNRILQVPDKSGTIALTNDLGAFTIVGEKAFTVEKTASKTYAQGLAELKSQVQTYLANGNYFMPRSLNITGSVGLIASSGVMATASSVEIRAFGWEPTQVEMFTIVDTNISKFVISSNSKVSLNSTVMAGNLLFRGIEYKPV